MSFTTDQLASTLDRLISEFKNGRKRIVIENAGGYKFGGKHIYMEDNK